MLDLTYLLTLGPRLFHSVVETLSYGDTTMKPIISLALLGAVAFATRKVLRQWPSQAWEYAKRKMTVSMSLLREEGQSTFNFTRFLKLYDSNSVIKRSRIIRLVIEQGKTIKGPGNGLHWFWYKRKFYWFFLRDLESSGSEKIKSELIVRTFGFSDSAMDELIKAFAWNAPDGPAFYTFEGHARDMWKRTASIDHVTLDDLVIPQEQLDELRSSLKWFLENEDWYRRRFLDYKLIIMLHGEPGTGKSILAKAIATHVNRNLCAVSLRMSEHAFNASMREAPKKGIFLMEDFDDVRSMLDRSQSSAVNEHVREVRGGDGIPLSVFLNALQGVATSNGRIVIMSTNHLEVLDPAIYRDSRVDLMLHIKALTPDLIIKYVGRMYSPEQAATITRPLKPMNASSLAHLFRKHPHDFDAYVKAIFDHKSQIDPDFQEPPQLQLAA